MGQKKKDVKVLEKLLNEYKKLVLETEEGTTQYKKRLKQGFPEGHDLSDQIENYSKFIRTNKFKLEELHKKILEAMVPPKFF